MILQDSIQQQTTVEDNAEVVLHRPLTPAQVLKWLPRDATPAQQDSAIQANFQPSEIHWSERPDTLHLPGHDKGHNMLDVQLPEYYREGFFSEDSLFHPELPGGRYGTAGDPVPYSLHHDNVMTGLLLLFFMLAVISISKIRTILIRQAKNFFHTPHKGTTEVTETTSELRYLSFLMLLSFLQISQLFYFYTIYYIGSTFILASQYYLIAIYLGIIIGYFMVKSLLYAIVNLVFFDGKRNGQWLRALMFITVYEGILLFPAVIVQAYYEYPVQFVIIYLTFVLLVVKIMTIYKCYVIFFRRNVVCLQIILYLCALEIVPMLALWEFLVMTANSLKIIF